MSDLFQTGDVFENDWARWEVVRAPSDKDHIVVEVMTGEKKRVSGREIIERFAVSETL